MADPTNPLPESQTDYDFFMDSEPASQEPFSQVITESLDQDEGPPIRTSTRVAARSSARGKQKEAPTRNLAPVKGDKASQKEATATHTLQLGILKVQEDLDQSRMESAQQLTDHTSRLDSQDKRLSNIDSKLETINSHLLSLITRETNVSVKRPLSPGFPASEAASSDSDKRFCNGLSTHMPPSYAPEYTTPAFPPLLISNPASTSIAPTLALQSTTRNILLGPAQWTADRLENVQIFRQKILPLLNNPHILPLPDSIFPREGSNFASMRFTSAAQAEALMRSLPGSPLSQMRPNFSMSYDNVAPTPLAQDDDFFSPPPPSTYRRRGESSRGRGFGRRGY
ncbi:hypothetical protein CALVIDRAFT_559563 [Calocera viscosa TUFC12733]|uniref:Uncharacterized protein n=1 Tax=Calocera viscosa (strain TUFC12733) TaxID=1330018 RepID=A0A167SBV4_CALVF|nr:hypothetical protein CALVIDRAFT_559563 [Calocera viscosa TUFC12733]